MKSVESAHGNACDEELSHKHAVNDSGDEIFNMIKEDFSFGVIVNFYVRMRKSVKSEHTKCLKDKMLKNTMMADTKKRKKIVCIEDVKRATN